MKSLSLAGLALALALSAESVAGEVITIGITTGTVEEETDVISGFALAAERGHLKVPIYKDAAQ